MKLLKTVNKCEHFVTTLVLCLVKVSNTSKKYEEIFGKSVEGNLDPLVTRRKTVVSYQK